LTDGCAMLSQDLQNELGSTGYQTSDQGNEVVISTKKKAPEEEDSKPKKKLSSAQRKRLARLRAKRDKKIQRQAIFKSLQEKALSDKQMELLRPTYTLGEKDSLKSRLKRAFLEEQQLGYSLTPAELLVKRHKASHPEEEDEEEMEVEEEKTTTVNPNSNPNPNPKTANNNNKKRKAQPQPQPQKPQQQVVKYKKRKVDDHKGIDQTPRPVVVVDTPLEHPTIQLHPQLQPQCPPLERKGVSNVEVRRTEEVIKQRSQLPIFMEEQRIMEAISENEVIIICGETGSGKTTQVPQFLYEAGYGTKHSGHEGMVGITQPRRVAAVSMAARVAHELNLSHSHIVSHQVRYDSEVTEETRIKFMTDGILLREVQSDFLLKKYSVIIIDEAHERNINTDILIGLLSRIVPLRYKLFSQNKKYSDVVVAKDYDEPDQPVTPLKLVIMSATLRVADFSENSRLFPTPPPILQVEARQYPVTIHFNRVTPLDNYLDAVFKKVCRIHSDLPAGGILVFLTGQQEITTLCRKLNKKFREINKRITAEKRKLQAAGKNMKTQQKDNTTEQTSSETNKLTEEKEEKKEEEKVKGVKVIPLYSALPTHRQLMVFEEVPDGFRKVVVATNVAETSITIPDIAYVVDSGRVKQKHYEKVSGISSFEIDWTSKASANQRAGRAGRTQAGHAYRIYSSAVFNDYFPDFTEPEINRIPIEGVILQMKSMAIDKILSFPFPSPPDPLSLQQGIKVLSYLGALDKKENITSLGLSLASFPLAPRFAKMLVLGEQGGCLGYMIAIVAALSVRSPFLHDYDDLLLPEEESQTKESEGQEKNKKEKKKEEEGEEEDARAKRQRKKEEEDALKSKRRELRKQRQDTFRKWKNEKSDILTVLNVIGAYHYAGATDEFCSENYLDPKIMREIQQLRSQLTYIVNQQFPNVNLDFNEPLLPPNNTQALLLRQIIAAGFVDQVCRLDVDYNERGFSNVIGRKLHRYVMCMTNEEAYIHPSSVLFKESPEYVVYHEIWATSKNYMKGVTVIHPKWLASLGTTLCSPGKPLESPPPRYKKETDQIMCFVAPRYGPHVWSLPPIEMPMKPGNQLYLHFLRFLLEAKIFPSLSCLLDKMNGVPSTITSNSYAVRAQHKVSVFLQTLSRYNVSSKKSLLAHWRKNHEFLYAEMKLWIRTEHWGLLKKCWDNLDAQ